MFSQRALQQIPLELISAKVNYFLVFFKIKKKKKKKKKKKNWWTSDDINTRALIGYLSQFLFDYVIMMVPRLGFRQPPPWKIWFPSEACSEPCETLKVEFFAEFVEAY